MTEVSSPVTVFAFDRLDAASPVHSLREKARQRFDEMGFPTTRDEAWRYTSVKRIAETTFEPAKDASISPDALQPVSLNGTACDSIVFVNGRFAPDLSSIGELPGGARLASLSDVIASDFQSIQPHLAQIDRMEADPFASLNTACIEDGMLLHLPRGAVLARPVHVIYITTPDEGPTVTHPRNLIVAEAGSHGTIVETYFGASEGEYFTNVMTEIVAHDDAVVDLYRVQRESHQASFVSTLAVNCSGKSDVTAHTFSIGGKLVRNTVHACLDAEYAHATFNGLTLSHDEKHVDNHLRVEHLKPNCRSWQYYKSVLDDASRGVFTGRIFVEQDAQKTDAKQTNQGLLLSDEARMTTRPQLEIFADDVRCTHGATVGQIEEDQLFYLQTRGIDREAARTLLIYAFANEMISQVKVESLRSALEQILLTRLPRGDDLLSAG